METENDSKYIVPIVILLTPAFSDLALAKTKQRAPVEVLKSMQSARYLLGRRSTLREHLSVCSI